jgi:hypothetical protein
MAASKRLPLALAAVLLGMLIGSLVWGVSARHEAEALAAGRATTGQHAVQSKDWNIPILSKFAQSFAGWDYKKVRALFTDDGVITTAGDTYTALYHNTKFLPGQRVDGREFRRRIDVHLGEPMRVVGTPVKVGNTIAFGWAFTGVSGTGLLHLRDGKIVLAIIDPGKAGPVDLPFGD